MIAKEEQMANLLLSQGGHIAPGDQKTLFYHAKPHPHGFHCEA